MRSMVCRAMQQGVWGDAARCVEGWSRVCGVVSRVRLQNRMSYIPPHHVLNVWCHSEIRFIVQGISISGAYGLASLWHREANV